MTKIPVLHVITRLIVGGAQENTIGRFVSALTADLLDPRPLRRGRYQRPADWL